MPHVPLWFWIVFNACVLALLALDLAIHRKSHQISVQRALGWTAFWVLLAAGFAAAIFFYAGHNKGLEFVTGYILEESLSVDNLFIFLLLFRYFHVPRQYQHRVLFWGIIGALVMRGVFILVGVSLLRKFDWIIYLFGAFLIYSGSQLFKKDQREIHPEANPVLKLLRRFLSITKNYEGGKFFVLREGKRWVTPLFLVLLVIEVTDVLFATDSIPAILAITPDPFIVYTSNVFAVLGLRSLYFLLAGIMDVFRYLHYGLAAILIFIGVKMLLSHHYHIPTGVALGVVGGILLLSIAASMLFPDSSGTAQKI